MKTYKEDIELSYTLTGNNELEKIKDLIRQSEDTLELLIQAWEK